MNKDIELWKEIPGYEGYYEASSHGNVRSQMRTITPKTGSSYIIGPKAMTQTSTHDGYKTVRLSRNGISKNLRVNRLVLLAFIGCPNDGEESCHSNGDRSDNRLDNLRWGSRSANAKDRVAHGNQRNIHASHCPYGHEYAEWNMVEAAKRQGRRACVACARARAAVQNARRCKGIDLSQQFQEIADKKFKVLATANN